MAKILNCPLYNYLANNIRPTVTNHSLLKDTIECWKLVPGTNNTWNDSWLVEQAIAHLSSSFLYIDFVGWAELIHSQCCLAKNPETHGALSRAQILSHLIERDDFLVGPYINPIENYAHHISTWSFKELNAEVIMKLFHQHFNDEDQLNFR